MQPDKDAQHRGPTLIVDNDPNGRMAADAARYELRNIELDREAMATTESAREMLNTMQRPLVEALRERRAAYLARKQEEI
jgi:hypothetical protein